MSSASVSVKFKLFPLNSTVPPALLPLYHVMLGSGFPSTGQVKETELARGTLVLRPLLVFDGESEKKNWTQKMHRYSLGLIAHQ